MKLIILAIFSFSAFAQQGTKEIQHSTYKCHFQGEAKNFTLKIERTANPYKQVFIGSTEYRLGTQDGKLLYNSAGTIKIEMANPVSGQVRKKAFICE